MDESRDSDLSFGYRGPGKLCTPPGIGYYPTRFWKVSRISITLQGRLDERNIPVAMPSSTVMKPNI